jgi:signal transduction histidine kinase
MPGKRSMSQSYLRSLVMLATVPVMLLGYLWISEQQRRFEEQSNNWRTTYIEAQQQALRRRVADIVGNLDFQRETLDRRQRETLERAVDNGMAQLDILVHFAKVSQPREQLLRRAHDLLAPIRFGNGRDHYFMLTDSGTALLLPAYPQWVNRDVNALRDVNGIAFAAKMMQQVRANGDAYLDAWFPQTDGRSGALLTTQYLRYYAPLGIFLGAAAYVDDMTQAVQREELARLANKAGQEEMVLRIVDNNNVVLLDTLNPELRGQHVPAEEGADKTAAAQMKKINAGAEGGFVQLQRSHRLGVDSPRPILMYMRSYPGWHWSIGAGYFLDPLESAIEQQRTVLQRNINHRVIEGALVMGLLTVIAVLIARQLALRTRRALQDFTHFFAEASRTATSIDVAQLPYSEFEQLARAANAMVGQRNKIEHALRTSEERFEKALSAAGSHLWDFNVRDKAVMVGGSLFKQLGYSPEARQIDVAEWPEWVHPDDLPEVLGAMSTSTDSRANFASARKTARIAGSYRAAAKWISMRTANRCARWER